MLQKIWPKLLAICLFSSCGGGLNPYVCYNSFESKQLDCANRSKKKKVPYAKLKGYYFYPPQSAQAMLDYCANRHQANTQPPDFTGCKVDLTYNDLNCEKFDCSIIPQGGGILCAKNATPQHMQYSDADQWMAFSTADNQSILDTCNIKLEF